MQDKARQQMEECDTLRKAERVFAVYEGKPEERKNHDGHGNKHGGADNTKKMLEEFD